MTSDSNRRPGDDSEAAINNKAGRPSPTIAAPADADAQPHRAAVYGAGRIRRSRATQAEMQHRYDALYDIVSENQPTGIRFTYYTAKELGIVDKSQSGYEKVQRAILDLRRAGVIPWSWIVDSHRWMRKPTTWGSLDEMLTDAGASYRRALWRDSSVAVEVWCESESVAGVLNPVTDRWDVPLYPVKGQTSDSFAWGAAQQYRQDRRRLVIYYFGDHDPHGYEIETNLRAKLVHFSGRDDIEWLRLACDTSAVADLQLTGSTPKKSTYVDAWLNCHVPWTGPAVEVEAIKPPILRSWLTYAIDQWIDPQRLAMLDVAEQSEREILLAMRGRS